MLGQSERVLIVLLPDQSQGFLIDGFPIDAAQATAFEADIGAPNAILFFQAENNVLKDRLIATGNFDDNLASIE